ncbi:zeta toxin family protein (plasmid) [Streptomyces xanthophaeus]|uniref:zeta toxin family protein n=1 Tax=Streptomyces xanthophaeus TaxID=67385 RepID=UPI002F916000|nr:zeta toxin family protein [Streptomyces xanthophaeus]WST65863.1 zeta toxin family protein [Streptomyces xanthophaeus]
MTDLDEVERYRLPEAENRRIFHEGIVPDLLEGRSAQKTPTVVFLIGQPGAGKSRVTAMVAGVLNQHGGFVDVDSDLYKPYHPAYSALMAQDDTLMAAYTRADGRAWMAQAEEYVRSHKLHAIIQETSQNAGAVEDKMLAYRRAGARVEALFMGVPQAMSNQGIVSRYFEQLADRGQGRLTVQSNADESYRGILALADSVDEGALANTASIYRRGESKPRYSNTVAASGDWTSPPALADALEAERTRPWTAAESEAFVATQLRLREASRDMGPEWYERLTRIEQQAMPLLGPAADGGPHLGLLSDPQLATWAERLRNAEQAAHLQAQPAQPTPADDIARRLQEQGASPESISRAQQTAAEDHQHARRTAALAGEQGDRIQRLGQRAAAELQRRDQLPFAQREQEAGIRHQMQPLAEPRPPASPAPAPRIEPPKGQAQARGRSL